MGFKDKILERIEKDSIKVDVDNGFIYLKKSGLIKEWHVIYPPFDMESVEEATDENGNVDWSKVKVNRTNLLFGGKSNAIKTFLVGILILLLSLCIRWIVKLI